MNALRTLSTNHWETQQLSANSISGMQTPTLWRRNKFQFNEQKHRGTLLLQTEAQRRAAATWKELHGLMQKDPVTLSGERARHYGCTV